ncbi:MAG: DUF11 domain-containing protein [Actinomycetota bacterium]|nr:DUF11 domain-containing protein [Actinomycetota bacterium]
MFAVGLIGAAQASAAVSPTPIVRPFAVRYAINTNGDIAMASNTLLTCKTGDVETQSHVGCGDVQNGGVGDDNYFNMQYVDVDQDATTFDSSSANLSIPAGATVLFAGLYWGAALDQGETLPLQCDPGQPRTGLAAGNPAAAGSAWLQGPNTGGYVPVNASVFDTYTEDLGCPAAGVDERTRYQGFADVTSLVQHGGGGTYTIANVQAGTGADRHAGWSLVVAYQDLTQPARNLTIFDGFGQVALNANVPITVSGFKTSPTGAVNTQIGFVAYEGDRNLTGDGLALNGTALGDLAHPSGNFFDSSISQLGTPVSGSVPDYKNQLGFDTGVLAVPTGVVGHNQTSANINLSTVQDRYLPGVVYFRTDIYAPQMVLHKTVTDVNGGAVNPGDVLQYDIGSTNTGSSSAFDSRISDAIPPHTAYQAGSLNIVSSPGVGVPGVKTDPTDADQAEFDSAANAVRFRIGTGATSFNGGVAPFADGGGIIAPRESFSVRFNVVVGADTPDGTQILNTAVLSSKDDAGNDYTSIASAPAAVTVRSVPDVTIDKSHTGTTWVRGQQGTFNLVVSNVGGLATSGSVVIDDTLPNGLGIVSASGANWTCSVNMPPANSLHCHRSDPLAPGAAYEPVSVVANVLESAPDSVVNTGVTGGGGETNTSNNSDTDTVPIVSNGDVAIVKSVTPTTTPPSKNVTYTLLVTNNGPSTAKDVKVADPLPAGMTFVSVTPSACGLDGTVVRCSLGDLVKGQSVPITVVSGIPLSLANKTKKNEATVSSTTPDSDLSNNKDDATVKITGAPPSKILVRKKASPTGVVLKGGNSPTVTFTMVLKVPSTIDAKQVDVCDTLPAHMVFATPSITGATISNGRVCWHLDVAKAQSTHEFKFTAKVDSDFKGASLKNVVVATAGNAPKVSANAHVDVAHVQGVTKKSPVTG